MKTKSFLSFQILVLLSTAGFAPGAENSVASNANRVQAAASWSVVQHHNGNYALPVPPHFRPVTEPGDRTGLAFISPDGEFALSAWGDSLDRDGSTFIAGALRATMQIPGRKVTYQRSGQTWFVASGFDRNGMEFYEKVIARGNRSAGFTATYPRSRRPEFDPLVEKIEDGFRLVLPGDPQQTKRVFPVAVSPERADLRANDQRESVRPEALEFPPPVSPPPSSNKKARPPSKPAPGTSKKSSSVASSAVKKKPGIADKPPSSKPDNEKEEETNSPGGTSESTVDSDNSNVQKLSSSSSSAPAETPAPQNSVVKKPEASSSPSPSYTPAGAPPPKSATSSSSSTPAAAPLPYGRPVLGREGFVFTPYSDKGIVDVAGLSPGTRVECPYTGKHFRVP